MSGITQAQALAVLRDLVELHGRVDPEVLAWVATVAAERETVGPWRQHGSEMYRTALGETVARVWFAPAGWCWEAHRIARSGGYTVTGRLGCVSRQDAMALADNALRQHGYTCCEVTP